MRLVLVTLLALTLAAAIGLGATWTTATRGTDIGTLTIGAWTARPRTGTTDVDPYSRASIARSGELPIGTGDGVAFSASRDDSKRPLDGRCDVLVSGITPPARFWTLTLYDAKGRLVANTLQRYGFTSEEVVRSADGSFEVRVAAQQQSEHPHVFTTAQIIYQVTGREVDEAAMLRAIELSALHYCPAQAMLSKAFPMELTYEIYEDSGNGAAALVKQGKWEK